MPAIGINISPPLRNRHCSSKKFTPSSAHDKRTKPEILRAQPCARLNPVRVQSLQWKLLDEDFRRLQQLSARNLWDQFCCPPLNHIAVNHSATLLGPTLPISATFVPSAYPNREHARLRQTVK
jgi:hypothetical protein